MTGTDVLVSARQLAAALKAIGGVVQGKSSLAACRGVRLTSNAGTLTLTTTNLETTLETQILAHGWTFDVVVEHGQLARAVVASGDDRVMLALAGPLLAVTQGTRSIYIETQSADETFPARRAIAGVCVGELDGKQLERLKLGVLEAAAKDDSRPVLAGVHLAWADDELVLSAADGFRAALMRVETAGDHEGTTGSITVPAAVLRLVGAVNGSGLDITGYERLTDDQAYVRLQWRAGTRKDCVIVTAIVAGIPGKYPDLAQVAPQIADDGGYAVTLASDVIQAAVKLKVANGRLAFADGCAVAELEGGACVAWSAGARIDAPLTADGTQVAGALNVAYLAWAARSIGGSELALHGNGLDQAYRVDGDGLTLVIMPMVGDSAGLFRGAGYGAVADAIEAAAERRKLLERERKAARIEREMAEHERATQAA